MSWLLLCGLAVAHNPHDPFSLLGISPAYESDGHLLGARTPAQNWRPMEIVRSDDDGVLWEPATSGLALRAPLSGLALSSAYDVDGIAVVSSLDGSFLTADGAVTWSDAGLEGRMLTGAAVADGAVDPVLVMVEVAGAVWVSVDLGATWNSDLLGLGEVPVVHGAGEHVAVASDGTVWVSHDAAQTWESDVLPGLASSVTVADNGDVFVGMDIGIYGLPNGGPGSLLPGVSAPVAAIGMGPEWPADPLLIVAETESDEVYLSVDGGQSFARRDLDINLSDQANGRHFYSIQVATIASGVRIFVNMFEGLLFSDDLGMSWTQRDTRPPHLITGVAVSPEFVTDRTVVVGTYDGGAYLSSDAGDAFTVRNSDLLRPNVYDVAIPMGPLGPELWVATLGYLARGELGGPGYTLDTLYEGGTYPTQIGASPMYATDGFALSGTRGDGILRTVDFGASWAPRTPRLSQITSVAIADDGTALAASLDGTVRATGDGGSSWSNVPGFEVASAPSFVAYADGVYLIGAVHGLYSFDGTSVVPIPEVEGPIEQVAMGADGTRFAVVRGGPILRSDPGQPFVDLGLADGLVPHELTLSPDFGNDDTVFASTSTMLMRSFDRGVSWERVDPDPVRYEETSQAVLSFGPLQSLPVAGGSARTASVVTPDEFVTLTFYGTGVTWLGATGGGVADVDLDGAFLTQVDTSATTTDVIGETVFLEVTGLSLGPHTITIRSAATADIYVDAFDVTRAEPGSTTTTPPTDGATDSTVLPGDSTDYGAPDDDSTDEEPSAEDDKGCGCSGSGAPAAGWGLWLAGATWLMPRRR